jgi:menaquinone-dependent protoporphyrinogen IX oxidase
MKGIIVYESKSGATATYAKWLAEETGFEAVPARKARRLGDYDLVVIGSCVRMYRPALTKWITARWPVLAAKKPVLFTVAGAPADNPKRTEWVAAALGDIAAQLPHFPLDGKMKFAEMPWLDRQLMKMAVKMTAKSNPEEAAKMGQEFDRVNRDGLEALRRHLTECGVALKRV